MVQPLSVQETWIAPNSTVGGSAMPVDSFTLFGHPDQMKDLLSKTSVYEFSWENTLQFSPAQLKQAVKVLNARNIKIAYEWANMLGYSCDAHPNASVGQRKQIMAREAVKYLNQVLQPIWDAGGTVTYVSMDGSGIGNASDGNAGSCALSLQDVSDTMPIMMKLVHQSHPEIQFGLLPNFPNYYYNGTSCYFSTCSTFGNADYKDVLDMIMTSVNGAGEQLTFMNVDNPYNYLSGHNGGVDVIQQRLLPLKAQAESYGLRFGLIFNSQLPGSPDQNTATDLAFQSQTIQYVNTMAAAGALNMSNMIVESWFTNYPSVILPETQDGSFTNVAVLAIDQFIRAQPTTPVPLTQAPTTLQAAVTAVAVATVTTSSTTSAVVATVDSSVQTQADAQAQAQAQTEAQARQAAAQAAQASAAAVQAAAQQSAADAQAAAAAAFAARQTQTVYRYANSGGYHLFALTADGTGVPSNYAIEGAVFNVYLVHYANTTALYRCNTNNHQFLSTDASCEGQVVKGLLGFVSTVQVQNLQPLVRLQNSGDYIEDTNPDAYTSVGYSVEGVLGYVP